MYMKIPRLLKTCLSRDGLLLANVCHFYQEETFLVIHVTK